MAKRFPETIETQPELLAHHYTEAGLIEQAIPYWQKAGERANRHSANMEAINHYTKGLEFLRTIPDAAKRAQQELALQIALGDRVKSRQRAVGGVRSLRVEAGEQRQCAKRTITVRQPSWI